METTNKYLTFKVKDYLLGVPLESLNEIVNLSGITKLPNVKESIMGTMNLRGKIIGVYDSRKILGQASVIEERKQLIEELKQREQDHCNWLNNLEKCIKGKTQITVQRDPHKCAFGKWYDLHRTNFSKDIYLQSHLNSFDKPHQEIHALADTVSEIIKKGNYPEAEEVISSARNNKLRTMIKLFHEFYDLIDNQKNRDMALVLTNSSGLYALSVDSVESIEQFTQKQDLTASTNGLLNGSMGILDKEKMISLMDFDSFIKN